MWTIIIVETIAITLIGSLLHFTYEWSGRNKLVAIFSAVNESTWEHIKLALSGIFVCMLVDIWWLGDNPNYWLARNCSFIVPVIVIPVLFYSYRFFERKSILAVDISIFLVAAFVSSWVFASILELPAIDIFWRGFSMVIALIILPAYLLLTRFPLHNFLFRDPITGKYGIPKKSKKR